MTYYLISTEWTGANRAEHVNGDRIIISREPLRGNGNGRPVVIDGWAGTTNDTAAYAHGAYDTLEAARAALRANWPDAVAVDMDDDPDALEAYRPDALEHLGADGTLAWVSDAMPASLTADEVPGLVQEWADIARADGLVLDTRALERHLSQLAAQTAGAD